LRLTRRFAKITPPGNGRLRGPGRESLIGEVLIADAVFFVIGFVGEHQQRFVLRFPAKPRNRAIVGPGVEDVPISSAALCDEVLAGFACSAASVVFSTNPRRRAGLEYGGLRYSRRSAWRNWFAEGCTPARRNGPRWCTDRARRHPTRRWDCGH